VFLTAGLFGVSVLGAQAPLSTFARTDPTVHGYGLGVGSGQTSLLIGAYVLSLVAGALLFPLVTRVVTPRVALIGASTLVALGYLLFVPFHQGYLMVLGNSVKTVGGAVASAAFGIALATNAVGTAGSFAGYLTVWLTCGITALVAAVSLLFVPRTAFSDPA
jgi:hypothetical protein